MEDVKLLSQEKEKKKKSFDSLFFIRCSLLLLLLLNEREYIFMKQRKDTAQGLLQDGRPGVDKKKPNKGKKKPNKRKLAKERKGSRILFP